MKSAKNLLAVIMLTMLQTSYSKEQQAPQANGAAPEDTATLNIKFEDVEGKRLSDEDRELISGIIIQSEGEVRALLPTLPTEIEVTAVIIDRNIDVVGGVTGRANAPGKVLIEISSVFPGGISAAAQSSLSSSIFHEFHHLDRGWTIEGNKFGAGIAIAAVNEGLASVFSEEYSGEYFDEAYSYPEDADRWLEKILALPSDADYGTWMMDEHPDGLNAVGYRIGRYIIHQASAYSGKDVLELSKLSPAEILEMTAKATL